MIPRPAINSSSEKNRTLNNHPIPITIINDSEAFNQYLNVNIVNVNTGNNYLALTTCDLCTCFF